MAEKTEVQDTKSEQPAPERALPEWLLPVAGVAAVAGVATAYFFGWLGDVALAVICATAFLGLLAGIVAKAGLASADGRWRAAAMLLAALVFAVGALPAREVLIPGEAAAQKVLEVGGAPLELPADHWRLTVSAPLRPGGEAQVSYRLRVGDQTLHGTLERVIATRPAGRRGSVRVAEDHNIAFHELSLPAAGKVELASLTGQQDSRGLTVRAHHALPASIGFALMALALLIAIALESLVVARSAFTMSAAAAVSFAILVKTGAPGAWLGAVLGAALLSAGAGAIGGAILGWLGRRLGRAFAKPEETEKAAPAAKAARSGKRKPA